MAEEVKVEGNAEAVASSTRQRKKRKWDQPAESVIAISASPAGLMPLNSTAALSGLSLPGIFPSLVGVYPSMPTSTASAQISLAFSSVQQSAAAIIQKINQDLAAKGVVPPNKIQDEVIAREIVINDAEPGVRYKLTKRQTQEEIQAKTGAVVITRGKYKPPNGPADHEKALYLHISAGAHLKDTTERVRAVDQAAALVDEMLKQGRQILGPSSNGQLGTNSPLSAVVFVDFEADSSVDLISRIRGPNDQYINHIMHETGATVLLKGGACESSCSDEIPQPLHLLISAEHAKSLEDARSLTEHLLETIRAEVAGTRPPYFPPPVSYNLQQSPQIASNLELGNTSLPLSPAISAAVVSVSSNPISLPSLDVNAGLGSLKNYSAVPPPKQLFAADGGPGKVETGHLFDTSSVSTSSRSPLATFAGSFPTTYASGALHQSFSQQTYGIYPQASRGSEPHPSYSAYSGLYPQASPLQQVARALQRPAISQSTAQLSSCLPSESIKSPINTPAQRQVERQERQKRKFQEGPALKRDPLADQVLLPKHSKPVGSVETATAKSKLMPPPRTASTPSPGSMPPPPSVSMPPPSLPPALPRSKPNTGLPLSGAKSVPNQPAASESSFTSSRNILAPPASTKLPQPETPGIKLVEYGEDEDEDDDDNGRIEPTVSDELVATPYANGKPFWAV
ncbi:hypothetical protein GOP47_0016853 [Adiantum capillus-veneris]|uniref:Protein RIK n=1 Tax=Adiantum capillus-veneris TaxID=13818 RepID=A0A9D4UJD4_ADICA|nr:hypothetical protein GOP47_0016853 [Adiantum capillus-veneris]